MHKLGISGEAVEGKAIVQPAVQTGMAAKSRFVELGMTINGYCSIALMKARLWKGRFAGHVLPMKLFFWTGWEGNRDLLVDEISS